MPKSTAEGRCNTCRVQDLDVMTVSSLSETPYLGLCKMSLFLDDTWDSTAWTLVKLVQGVQILG